MENEDFLNLIKYISPIQSIEKNIELNSLWEDVDFKSDLFESKNIIEMINTMQYIYVHYGKGIFIKIRENKIDTFLPFKNNYIETYWQKLINLNGKYILDNYIVKKFNDDTYIDWIYEMFENLCNLRDIPDCEFFINSERNYPLITINRSIADKSISDFMLDYDIPIKQHTVFSFCTSDEFKDFAIPTLYDWERMKNNTFGITDFHLMKWSEKENKVLFVGDCLGKGIDTNKYPNKRLQLIEKLKNYFKKTNNNFTLTAGITTFPDEYVIQDSKLMKRVVLENFLLTENVDPISNYKFIFLVDGEGPPENMSNILFTGSCIIRIESDNNWQTWYEEILKPGIHYLSVDKNFLNLNSTLDYCLNNEVECEEIGLNSREFATTYLSKNSLFDYLQVLLCKIVEKGVTNYENDFKLLQYYLQKEKIEKYYTKSLYDFPNEANVNFEEMVNECYLIYENRYNYSFNQALNLIFSNLKYLDISEEVDKTKSSDVTIFKLNSTLNKSSIKLVKKTFENFIDGMNHSYIGFDCINELCKEIPNFCQTIYSNYMNNKFYIISEYIEGENIEKFLEKYPNKIFELIIQLCLCLQLAMERCFFIHGNLEAKNIIITSLKTPIKITYRLFNKTWAIKTKHVLVIINYEKSTVLSNLHNNKRFHRMFVGNDDAELLQYINKENKYYHANKDIKYLVKKLGKKFLRIKENNINQNLQDSDILNPPFEEMKNYVTKTDIKNNKIQFGISEDESLNTISPRYIANKIIDNKEEITERLYQNQIPTESTALGNVVLQYEITQYISSSFMNCDIKFSVNLTSEKIKNSLDFVKNYYENAIQKTLETNFEEDSLKTDDNLSSQIDLWAVRMFLRKYMSIILKHDLVKKFIHQLTLLLKSTLEESLKIGAKNTYNFYEKYMTKL